MDAAPLPQACLPAVSWLEASGRQCCMWCSQCLAQALGMKWFRKVHMPISVSWKVSTCVAKRNFLSATSSELQELLRQEYLCPEQGLKHPTFVTLLLHCGLNTCPLISPSLKSSGRWFFPFYRGYGDWGYLARDPQLSGILADPWTQQLPRVQDPNPEGSLESRKMVGPGCRVWGNLLSTTSLCLPLHTHGQQPRPLCVSSPKYLLPSFWGVAAACSLKCNYKGKI